MGRGRPDLVGLPDLAFVFLLFLLHLTTGEPPSPIGETPREEWSLPFLFQQKQHLRSLLYYSYGRPGSSEVL